MRRSWILLLTLTIIFTSLFPYSFAEGETDFVQPEIDASTYDLFNIGNARDPITDEEFEKYTADNNYSMSVNAELYPTPEIFGDLGAPKGEVVDGVIEDSEIYPGTTHDYRVYVPAAYDPQTPANLILFFDANFLATGDYPAFCYMLDNLIDSGELPVTIALFLSYGVPGPGQPVLGFNEGEVNRSLEYDTPSDRNARFVTEEVMPVALANYNISERAADHAVCGISSSGIGAFTLAWFKPEVFGKVYMTSASFVNIRSGIVWPSVIRMAEKKDIQVMAAVGKHDLDNIFGNWLYGNLQLGSALYFKGYNFRMYLTEAGHGAAYTYLMPDSLCWLFTDKEPEFENVELYDFSQQIAN